MRIGFDAKRAFCNKSGLGNYSRTLISSLEEFYKDNKYILFTPKKTINFETSAEIVMPQSPIAKLFPGSIFKCNARFKKVRAR